MKIPNGLEACLLLILISVSARGEVWDASDDFSSTANPGGAWSYGWRNTATDPLVLYENRSSHEYWGCPLDVWYHDVYEWCPHIEHNPLDEPLDCGPSHTIRLPAHSVDLHPGPSQQSVLRWTAPQDMRISFTTDFEAADLGSSLVHVYSNGIEIFSQSISGVGDHATFSAELVVEKGWVIDCAVDPLSFYYDTVLVDFRLENDTPVPVEQVSWGKLKTRHR